MTEALKDRESEIKGDTKKMTERSAQTQPQHLIAALSQQVVQVRHISEDSAWGCVCVCVRWLIAAM